SRRRHTRSKRDWSSDVCSSDLSDKARSYSARRSSVFVLPEPRNSNHCGVTICPCFVAITTLGYSLATAVSSSTCHASASESTRRSEERRVGKGSRYRVWRDHDI